MRQSALVLAGPDVGVGTAAERATLIEHLKLDITKGSYAAKVVERIESTASAGYLTRWATAIAAAPRPVGTERLARAVAGHLLGLNLSAEYCTAGGAIASTMSLASAHSRI